MTLETAAVVDQGVRENNDDRALLGNTLCTQGTAQGKQRFPFLVAICDGVGGNIGGGYAAELALDALRQNCPDINGGLTAAEQTIRARQNEDYPGMCTTVAGIYFEEMGMTLFHAGDSRIYRYDGTYLARMTNDHSLVQELQDMGLLTAEEARTDPRRNRITRCLGLGTPPPQVQVSRRTVQQGETFLLCSDGLWDVLSDDTIREILHTDLPAAEKAQRLVKLAKANGSADNITALLVAAPPAPPQPKPQPFIVE